MENPITNELSQTLETVKAMIVSEVGVVLYFSTINCGVCQALKPKIAHLISEHFPLLKFEEVKSNLNPEIAGYFGVFSASTLLVFFEGKEFLRKVRNMSIVELEQKIKRPYNLLTK